MNGYRPDTRRLLAAQGLRAFAYGFSAVLLGTSLEERDVPAWQVGLVLGATVAGTAVMAVLVARYADRVGRRRWYAGLYVLLGVVGVVFAVAGSLLLLVAAALTGVVSTEVIESGSVHVPGATDAGRGPAGPGAGARVRRVERDRRGGRFVRGAHGRYAQPDQRGSAPAVVLVLVPVAVAGWAMLPTMVFTHLPSNLLLAAVAFAPNLATAVVLLARTCRRWTS